MRKALTGEWFIVSAPRIGINASGQDTNDGHEDWRANIPVSSRDSRMAVKPIDPTTKYTQRHPTAKTRVPTQSLQQVTAV